MLACPCHLAINGGPFAKSKLQDNADNILGGLW